MYALLNNEWFWGIYFFSVLTQILVGLNFVNERENEADLRLGVRLIVSSPLLLGAFWILLKILVKVIRLIPLVIKYTLPSKEEKAQILKYWAKTSNPPQNPATHL